MLTAFSLRQDFRNHKPNLKHSSRFLEAHHIERNNTEPEVSVCATTIALNLIDSLVPRTALQSHYNKVKTGELRNKVPAKTNVITALSKMKHLAAYLLLGLAGNSEPSAEDIEGVLSSVGIEADKERLDSLLKELEGKDINQVYIRAWIQNLRITALTRYS